MSATHLTLTEVLESATGFDEIAVDKAFGIDLYAGNEAKPMNVPRALVFLHQKHQGMTDADAKAYAMNLRLGDLNDYFADDPEEVDDDEPETESGKDSTLPE